MDCYEDRREDREAPGLFPEEEKALWARFAQGDEEARERLVLAYRPLVFWIAQKFGVSHFTLGDLVQEGMMALLKSMDNYDPCKGIRFSTYGFYRIRGSMVNYLQRVEGKAPLPMEDMEYALGSEDIQDTLDLVLTVEHEMGKLQEREAEVVRSLIIQGVRAKEYAEAHHLDVSHVYRIQRRALEKLRRWMGVAEPQKQPERG